MNNRQLYYRAGSGRRYQLYCYRAANDWGATSQGRAGGSNQWGGLQCVWSSSAWHHMEKNLQHWRLCRRHSTGQISRLFADSVVSMVLAILQRASYASCLLYSTLIDILPFYFKVYVTEIV